MTPAQVHARVADGLVSIRIAGRATCRLGPALRDFVQRAGDDGLRRFEVDLGACEYMDSTFIGGFNQIWSPGWKSSMTSAWPAANV